MRRLGEMRPGEMQGPRDEKVNDASRGILEQGWARLKVSSQGTHRAAEEEEGDGKG